MVNDYFETLGATMDEIVARLATANAVLAPAEGTPIVIVAADLGPVSYGCVLRHSYPLASLKGKATKKYFHVSIYRMDSGRYELTTYVL